MQDRSRVALVVGSRYGAAGDGELACAPEAARRFADVLARPENGWRVFGGSALIDPTVTAFLEAAEEAIAEADASNAQLLFSFVGHGLSKADSAVAGGYPSFYLQVRDSSPNPRSTRDFNLGLVLHDSLEGYRSINGVILVIDACDAGAVPAEAVANWNDLTGGRLEVLVASEHGGSASGCCFTTTLTRILEDGLPSGGDDLLPIQVVLPINAQCTNQRASYSGFTYGNLNGSRPV